MKLVGVIFVVLGGTFAQYPYNHYPYNDDLNYPSAYNKDGRYVSNYQPFAYSPKYVHLNDDRHAQTLRFDRVRNPDGSYQYGYETDNGIAVQEVGTPKHVDGNTPVVVQGSFQWTSPEGKNIAIAYTADENGYQPVGDAIPTPPPVPEAILRSIEFNKREAERRRRQ